MNRSFRQLVFFIGAAAAFGLGGLFALSRDRLTAAHPAAPSALTPVGRIQAGTTPSGRRLVGYYPLWIQDVQPPSSFDFSNLTHVVQSAVYPRADGTLDLTADGSFPTPDFVDAVHAGGARAVLSVADNEGSHAFSQMVANGDSRQVFISRLMKIVDRYGYDGVDVDWEFPASAADRDNLTTLVGLLRAVLGPNRSLSLAAPGTARAAQWLDVANLSPNLDWLTAMTYDLSSADASIYADNNAGLYAGRSGEDSVDAAVSFYLAQGVPHDRLLIGLPFYGQKFDLAGGLHQPLRGAAPAKRIDYRDIPGLLISGWLPYRDLAAQVPYLVRSSGLGLISYDDAGSIAAKCAYAEARGLGGGAIWYLGADLSDGVSPLLQAAQSCR